MFAIAVYTIVAASAGLAAQACRPNDALGNRHHQRLYWMGAVAVIGIGGLCTGAMIV